MRPLARALLLASALLAQPLLPWGAASPAVAQDTNRIVAVVNGDIVTRADIEGRRRLFAINAGLPVSPEVLNRLTPQVTRLLIDERLCVGCDNCEKFLKLEGDADKVMRFTSKSFSG